MVISNKLKYTNDIHRMTGCLDQLSYWASFWWKCFSQNAENHEIFGTLDSFAIFWSKCFCHIFMV